uniref:DNA 3'-5' helicase n=1 Tax=Strongyloides stercoralis TaxID=6248 RepID=A0AAF5DDE8_STRER
MYNLSRTLLPIIKSFQVRRMLITTFDCYRRPTVNIESNNCLKKNNAIEDVKHNKSISKSINELPKLFSETDFETIQYPWLPEARKILKEIFKKDDFLPSQLEAIKSVMSGKDCLIIKSTGGGKSLCYQLPCLLKNGFCIVITPLLSLINDQLIKLKNLQIPSITINSSLTDEERDKIFDDIMNDKVNYKIIYITPEQYAYSKKIRTLIKKNSSNGKLLYIAIDEIHCLKDWAGTFRGTYNSLKRIKKRIKCPVIGLTATATDEYIEYFQENLILKKPVIVRSTVMRHNLIYQSIWKEKNSPLQIYNIIKSRFSNQSGIVYCLSRKESEKLASYLIKNGISASHYHGMMCKDERNQILQDWLDEKIRIVVGTNAFGMGIDKDNVRFIIHHTIPSRMFDYIQETGRAGRDGLPSTCIALFNIYDITRRIKLNINKPEAVSNTLQIINFLYSQNCKKKVIATMFNETFDEDSCRKNCETCNQSLEEIQVGSEKLLNTILGDTKKILKNPKENITQKKLSTSIQKNRPHWSKKEIDMLLTNLILKGNLKLIPQMIAGTKQTYIKNCK